MQIISVQPTEVSASSMALFSVSRPTVYTVYVCVFVNCMCICKLRITQVVNLINKITQSLSSGLCVYSYYIILETDL